LFGSNLRYIGDDMENGLPEVQHMLNPLHIFCRLIEKGYSTEIALVVAAIYEEELYDSFLDILVNNHNEDHEKS